MPTLTAAQVAGLVKNAGFPVDDQAIMVAISKAESGYNTTATHTNTNGTIDRGLFQINSVHSKFDPNQLLNDPQYNTNAAKTIFDGQGLNAWSTYTSGAYQKNMNEARAAVANSSSVTGSAVTSTNPTDPNGSGQQSVVYGPPGPQYTDAGIGTPLTSAQETDSPLTGLRVLGSELGGDYASVVINTPSYSAAMETIPNLTFTVADPEGNIMAQQANTWVRGAHVVYQDLDMRIDTIVFEPGTFMTGQITVTCVDDIVWRLMNLTGPRVAFGQSASQWIAEELRIVDIDPEQWLLAESVPMQSQISRDVPSQSGTETAGNAPSAWTTIVRLAQELGKRVFISGKRLVFGSSAFAMQWTAPSPIRLSWHELDWTERFMTIPTVTQTSVSSNANVTEVTGLIPLSRAKFFRPGVPVILRSVPGLITSDWLTMMCFTVDFTLGTDTQGASITLALPVNPPPQPPGGGTAAGINAGNTSSGTDVSGGGADGQIASFVALALQQAGKRYVYGAYASPSDPNPTAFDCSELVQWCCERTGITGCPRTSTAQRQWCDSNGKAIGVGTAIDTKGALLFANGHVAISLGNGKTIEAMNPQDGVRQGNALGARGWIEGGLIPGAQGYVEPPPGVGTGRAV